MKYTMTQPCDNCPFRFDIKTQEGWLGEERAEEIVEALERGEFPCHKTTVCSEDDDGFDECVATSESQHCAGALILMEFQEQPSQMVRTAERLGLYDRSNLKMDSPVFDSFNDFIEWHAG